MAKQDASVGPMTANQAVGIAEAYLSQLRDIWSTQANSPETSYYPALANLFNAVGKTLRPKVLCVMNLKNQGADNPDGGLFTADQSGRKSEAKLRAGLPPARGAIEAKSTKKEVKAIAASTQVAKYLNLYGIVIVTNLRDFLIVERGTNAHPVERESFSLADDERDFWQNRVAHPRTTAQHKGQQFIEFIKRACLHNAPLLSPKLVAWFLASYARDGLFRVEQQKQLPALQAVRSALEDALGMKFTADKGEHFFRSTLVQTLFYGVFSAWVSWHKANPNPSARFDWRTAEWSLHVPFIRTLYEQIASKSKLEPLGLIEVLDWGAGVLNRVDRAEFFKRFEDEHAVQYFYEPFLEAYDPDLRKELGVWYTPPEIVKYQVARVDTVLREELGVLNGLADPNVIVLDPCCGTGAYLVEVLRTIERTNRDMHDDALVAYDVKTAAMTRVFGFEILPAPFVVAHLQIGLLLQRMDLPLSIQKRERVAVYLTNALTGWEPPKGVKATLPLPYPELAEERDAAEKVKRQAPILVVLGNPPYNGFAGVALDEEARLIEPYKAGLKEWGITKNYLGNLYIRFFRLAERRIAEMTGKGVISFISSFSYMRHPSFVVMRDRFLRHFDCLWFDCMNGDSRETGKLTPDGKPDPSVFSTDYNREGIRVGTAVCVIVRKEKRDKKAVVRFRHFWGASKRQDLLASLDAKDFGATYTQAESAKENRYSFEPTETSNAYRSWPAVVELAGTKPLLGLNDNRRQGTHAIEEETIADRMKAYYDPKLSLEDVARLHSGLTTDAAGFHAADVRKRLLTVSIFQENNIVRFVFKPFDLRWAYIERTSNLWNRVRPELLAQAWAGNRFLLIRCHAPKAPDGATFHSVSHIADQHVMHTDAYFVPIRLQKEAGKAKGLFDEVCGPCEPIANLSPTARAYLADLGVKEPDADLKAAALIWMHALAIGYSPAYLMENADGIRRDWPHIPLPADRKAIEASAALGEQVAALLDTEADLPSTTGDNLRTIFRGIGVLTKVGGGGLDPNAGDFAVTAGWGHLGKGGVVMPAKRRLSERAYDAEELKAIEAEAAARGMTVKALIHLLGEKTCDVYLNGTAYWRNIPSNVWDYYIGGYQVIKKWLSYREQSILGRAIKAEEAREVMNMARRIAALILMQADLDANYEAVKANAWSWPQ